MVNTKRVLHVDGEYLKKANVEFDLLKDSLQRILGEVGYPTHLIYYGAHKVSELINSKLHELDIPNISINTDGYISLLSDGRRVQKGVDTTIVLNILRDKSEMIYLLSGDGDMFPLAKAYIEERNQRLITLSFKNSTSDELIKYSRNFLLDKFNDSDNFNKNIYNQNTESIEKIVYSAWLMESKEDSSKFLTASRLGQLGSYNQKFKLSNIKKKFEELSKKNYIEIKKSENTNNPDTLIRFIKAPNDTESILEVETMNLLKGGEVIEDEKVIGEIINKFYRGENQYFFIKSGKRNEDIYLNIKEVPSEYREKIDIGWKIKFDLKRGSGKNDIAINLEVIANV